MHEHAHDFFSTTGFMPHGHCYLWEPGLVGLHVVSDTLIALAYMTIPFTLAYFIRKRRDMPFHWMFLCFGAFIIACGMTHVMEIWTLWTPSYWVSGAVKAVTALASVPTAILLIRLIPKALVLPTPTQLSVVNDELEKARAVLEVRIRERTAELAELKRTEEAMRIAKDAAEVANRELETFSYSVAHDLRAPLRAMSGFSTALLEDYADNLDAQAKTYLNRITGAAETMSDVIDALLKLARLTRVELRREPVDLSQMARSIIDQLRAADPHRIVETVIADGLVVEGDAQLLRTMLENLLGNAWKFTSKRQGARIELGREDTVVGPAFYVRDNGAGFDMELADKLFAPFKRLHKPSEFEGHGIGLATVQRIANRHGGRVWAEGNEDRGATFRFTLVADLPAEARNVA